MRRNALLDELNFGNACKFISTQLAVEQNFGTMTPDVRNCSTLAKGVMTNGLNAAVQMYLQFVGAFVASIRSTQGIPNMASLIATAASADYSAVVGLLLYWLPAGFSIETNMYFTEQVTSLEDFVALRTTMLAVFLSALALIFVLVFEPLVYEMDMHVKRVRALLVMIPAEIAMSTASLRNALLSAV